MRLAALLLVAAFGCDGSSDDPPSPEDAGPADSGADAALDAGPTEDTPDIDWADQGEPAVVAPSIPWLADGAPAAPVFTCPAGWRPVVGTHGATTCDPWPDTGMEDCAADDEAHFPGEAGCRPVGRACPVDGWPADLPGTGVWYVSAGAVAGDGSLGAPFGTIGEAVTAAAAGDTVAVAAGRYDEALVISKALTLVGACARDTVLTSSSGGDNEYVIDVRHDGVELADLAIADGARGGILVTRGSATVSGLALARVQQFGILVEAGAQLSLSDVAIRDLVEAGWDSAYGTSTGLFNHGFLDASDLSVLGGSRGVLSCFEASELVDAVVIGQDTGFQICGTPPFPAATYARLVVERPTRMGIYVLGADPQAELSLVDAVVHDHSSSSNGGAVVASCLNQHTFDATLERVWVNGASYAGLNVHQNQCEVTLAGEDLVIEGVARDADGFGGMGVYAAAHSVELRSVQTTGCENAGIVAEGGSLDVTNALVSESGLTGLVALTESSVTWTDVAILDTPLEPGTTAYGATVASGSTAVASRVAIQRAWGLGLFVQDLDELGTTSFVGSDVVIEDVGAGEGGLKGFGVAAVGVGGNVTVDLSASTIDGGSDVGFLCQDAACSARDVRVSRIASQPCDGLYGGGFEVHAGALEVERAVLSEVQGSAIALFQREGIDSTGTLQDVAIHGVAPMTCAGDDRCPGLDAATGVYLESGSLEALRVLVHGAEGAGLQCSAGELTVSDALVTAGGVGTNFQGCTPTLTRVDASDTTTPESTDALPVPVP